MADNLKTDMGENSSISVFYFVYLKAHSHNNMLYYLLIKANKYNIYIGGLFYE